MNIRTVLCPIDFSSLSDYELALAVEVCQSFDARLVLHHNLAAAGPGFAKAWEWQETHSPEGGADDAGDESEEGEARRRLEAILAQLPSSVAGEARISRGPVGLVLLYLIDEIGADLVVLGSHGWSSEEHASLSERIIDRSPCPVLTFQEGRGERLFRLRGSDGEAPQKVLVPTDFSGSSAPAVDFAWDLARTLGLELHLLHVLTAQPRMVPVDHTGAVVGDAPDAAAEAGRRLRRLVPKDLPIAPACHVSAGSVGDEILAAAERLDTELIVMGEHAPGFLRHYFTHDTARELLHRARCPVWYVPAQKAAS